MEHEWKYKIGDVLKMKEERVRAWPIGGRKELSLPRSLRVRERVTIECHGGIQFFYRCIVDISKQTVDMAEYEVEIYDVDKELVEWTSSNPFPT